MLALLVVLSRPAWGVGVASKKGWSLNGWWLNAICFVHSKVQCKTHYKIHCWATLWFGFKSSRTLSTKMYQSCSVNDTKQSKLNLQSKVQRLKKNQKHIVQVVIEHNVLCSMYKVQFLRCTRHNEKLCRAVCCTMGWWLNAVQPKKWH